MTSPRESTIVSGILKALRALDNCYAIKTHGSAYATAGTPDIIGSYKASAFAIEVKRPGKTPTKLQVYTIGLWAEAGALTGVAYSTKDALDIVLER